MPLSVSLATTDLQVEPGGFVRAEVRIANSSPAAERVRVSVAGPAAPWSWVIPADVEVEGGGEAVAGVVFRIDRAAAMAPAGRHGFELVVTSDEGADEVRVPGTLTVATLRRISLHLEPEDAGHGAPPRRVVVVNDGNVPAPVRLTATSEDPALELELSAGVMTAPPGGTAEATLDVRGGRRRALGRTTARFTVTARSDDAGDAAPAGVTGSVEQLPRLARRPLVLAVAGLAVVLVVAGVLVAGGGGDADRSLAATGATTTTAGAGCPVEGHIDPRVNGLRPQDIPTLPSDYSFWDAADDGCTPVRWNPCEPVHYVINPADAPPTGPADVREAFRRLAEITGMTYVDDGLTDETGTVAGRRGREAYQPERYGERWAPILVHWQANNRGSEDVQVVGGGFPTLAGDVYVTGNLFLNPFAVTNAETRATVPGGFGATEGAGRIGPEGVTWGRIILHELAHITGLGHVRDPAQLMYPETSDHITRPARFDTGDLAGLRFLGKEAGCLTTPPLDTPTRGITGRRELQSSSTTAVPST